MVQRRIVIVALAAALWLGALGAVSHSARADDVTIDAGASKFIQSLAQQAIASLTNTEVARAERVERFRTLFKQSFAVRSIGKFVLGRYWKRASKDERTEYLILFEDLMVVSYVDRFAQYAGEALNVTKARKEKERLATVFSEISRPGGAKPIRVNWRVGSTGKAYKILDVTVEGTSMSTTLRSDFGSIIHQKDGQVLGLIEELRTKTASLREELKN